jgi:hypothetical protein
MNGQDSFGSDEVDDIDLRQFDEDFAAAPVEEGEFGDVPDDTYKVSVEKAELTNARSSGSPMLKWTLRILGPRFAGRYLWRHNMFATKENLRWLKKDLLICGLELVKLSELRDRLHELLDVQLEVTKRKKGEFTSIYINRRLALDEQGYEAADGHADQNDIPF